jgi:hypothetical protein
MAPPPVKLYSTTSTVPVGGTAVSIMWGPLVGGFLVNPVRAIEALFVDLTGPAALHATATTVALGPGQGFIVPDGFTGTVSVNAATSGHVFSSILLQPPTPFPPTPQPSNFPPADPTTLTAIIPSYLFQEYNDDDNLQSFVQSFNTLAQIYAAWFTNIDLPVYTNPGITGPLLDLVAGGIYGIARPLLSSGMARLIGPFNTYAFNTHQFNRLNLVGPADVAVTTDDVFKRIITWNFYKGDGNVVTPNWIKRRVLRFLTGANGTAPDIDETYPVSVTYAPNSVTIRINAGTGTVTSGPFNTLRFARLTFGKLTRSYNPGPTPFALQPILKEAMESGVLQMPFQMPATVQ